MVLSNSLELLVALLLDWCILGAFVGLLIGLLTRGLRHQYVPIIVDTILGTLGCLGGVFLSGSLNTSRPVLQTGPEWLKAGATAVAEHQNAIAIMSAVVCVVLGNAAGWLKHRGRT